MFDIRNAHNMRTPIFKDSARIVFADCIYESRKFGWILRYWQTLKRGGILIVISDYHSSAELKVFVESKIPEAVFVNWLVWKNEFGNFPKNKFRQCHDDILVFSRGSSYKFYPERVQVEKVTANCLGLNPSGRTTKIATLVITDICLTTVSKERIKKRDGTCIRWQKPIKLIERLITPFVDKEELIIDPFMGSGTSGIVARKLECRYLGIELDPQVFY